MLFLRARYVGLQYELSKNGKETTLWLNGTPTEPICLSTGGTLHAPVAITIASELRDGPYEVGSLFLEESSVGEHQKAQLWVYAPAAEIENIHNKCMNSKYVYLITQSNEHSILNREWRLDRGNPAAIHSYSFRASSIPCFGDSPDHE